MRRKHCTDWNVVTLDSLDAFGVAYWRGLNLENGAVGMEKVRVKYGGESTVKYGESHTVRTCLALGDHPGRKAGNRRTYYSNVAQARLTVPPSLSYIPSFLI